MPRLLSFKELRDHGVLFGRRWLSELEKRGEFPERVRIGQRRIGWPEDEVKQRMAQVFADRRGLPGPQPQKRKRRQRVLQKKKAG